MSNRLKFISIVAVIAVFVLLLTILIDIRNTYVELGSIKTELTQVKKEFQGYKSLVQKVNDIDTKFTQELTDAKNENNRLYNNVITGIGRLQFNINKTTTVSPTNAECARLDDSSQRNYFILRERIEQSRLQIEGLQSYIKEVCLNE